MKPLVNLSVVNLDTFINSMLREDDLPAGHAVRQRPQTGSGDVTVEGLVVKEHVGRELISLGSRVGRGGEEGELVGLAAVELDPHAHGPRVVGDGHEADGGGHQGRPQVVGDLHVRVGVAREDLEEFNETKIEDW